MKVSIVTVNKNNGVGLQKTINSVHNQTYKDFEFIVIDGDSSDDSKDIIKANKDIITVSISEPDAGIYDAMNKSLSMCHGDYVIFMNSGDCFYDANTLQNVFSTNSMSDVIYGDVYFDELSFANKNIHSLQDFYCRSPFCHQGVFTRTDLANTLKFDINYRIVADWIMFLQLFVRGYSFQYVPIVVARCESGGISSDYTKNTEERLRFLSSLYPSYILKDYQELQRIKSGVLWNYYQRLEKTKKIKYYVLKLLQLFQI